MHQSAPTIIFHSKHQKFGIRSLIHRQWHNPRFNDEFFMIPRWPAEGPVLQTLDPEEIDRILQEADKPLWPEIVEIEKKKS